MSPRCFTIMIDGTTLFCAACESERELDALLSGGAVRSSVHLSRSPGPAALDWPPRIEPERPRGRPSFDGVIAEAVAAMQLDPGTSLAERARRLLKHLAETRDGSEIPSRRTVETYLASSPTRKNSRNKSRRKSGRAKLSALGGS